MDQQRPGETATGRAGSIALAVSITERLGRLPAVATQDWCDLLASALAGVVSPSRAAVIVATVSPSGEITQPEASGAGEAGIGEQTDGRATVALRSAADRLRHIGWAPRPGELAGGVCGTMEALSGARGQRETGLWGDAEIGGVLFGLFPLGTSGGRSLIVQIGTLGDTRLNGQSGVDVLAAVLPAAARRLVLALGGPDGATGRWLTAREQQVLSELIEGKSVREIAESVGRSPHTVHDHVKSLHRKLGASSRGELVARALGHMGEPEGVPPGPAAVRAAAPGAAQDIEPKPDAPLRAGRIGH